jgi:N-acetylneuraminic acid mutarotase
MDFKMKGKVAHGRYVTYLLIALFLFTSGCVKDPDIPAGLQSLTRVSGWEKVKANYPSVFIARSNSVAISTQNRGFILGGGDLNNIQSSRYCFEYDFETNNISNTISELPFNAVGTVGFCIDHTIYCGTGVGTGGMSNTFYSLNIDEPYADWVPVPSFFPGVARSNAIAFVINNKAYVGCGTSGDDFLNDIYEFTRLLGI